MAEARLERVSKRFGATTAVEDVSLEISDGELVVLLGPTGAGKTTALRLLAGLETPDAGRVVIGGRDVTAAPPAVRDVAFVFQQYSLYPNLTVYDNLAFPLRSPARRVPEWDIDKQVKAIAGLLHLESKLDVRPTQLSGGQMQRVALGRALVRRPNIYLMDEPLSSLDAKLRAELRLELKRIQQELGATIVYVTHDQTEAMTLANRIGVLRQGRLVQVGTPREIYEDPCDTYVATRLGSPRINLIPRAAFPNLAAPADAATVGARTEHLRIRKATNGSADGTVTWIEHLGDQNRLHVSIAGQDVVTLADPEAGLSVGDAVSIKLSGPMFFGADGARLSAGATAPSRRSPMIDQAVQRKLIEAVAQAVVAHADELTALDQAIGDGDHGLNMKRGFESVLGSIDKLAAQPLPDALKAIGTELVMKVGGASGPLYGTLFLTVGKTLPADPSLADIERSLGAAIDAVKARGKSDTGQKTMLDVLAPAHAELAKGGGGLAARIAAAAHSAAEATKPMKALRGRASFLGERSVGHMDPGARSSALMIATVCKVLEG
jgi:multiple sugar transport system ATP-binding protein